MKIGIDIMGGDYAPVETVKGVLLAQEVLQDDNTQFVLLGDEKLIEAELAKHNASGKFEIIHTSEVIGMADHPVKAVTKKQDSSSQKIPKKLKKIDKLISGSWTVSSVMNSVGNIDSIPNEQKYILKLSTDNKNKTFEVDNVKGNWDLKDSILTMENIPESKEYVDSIFIINDAYGNSEVILKN